MAILLRDSSAWTNSALRRRSATGATTLTARGLPRLRQLETSKAPEHSGAFFTLCVGERQFAAAHPEQADEPSVFAEHAGGSVVDGPSSLGLGR